MKHPFNPIESGAALFLCSWFAILVFFSLVIFLMGAI
jgi:hypothetical protein